jgi:hypothetical protein
VSIFWTLLDNPDHCELAGQEFFLSKTFNIEILSITGGAPIKGVMPNPYNASVILTLAGVDGKRLSFSTFAENAKVAATGFERETRGDLSSLSNSLRARNDHGHCGRLRARIYHNPPLCNGTVRGFGAPRSNAWEIGPTMSIIMRSIYLLKVNKGR